jgi:hypothetical protein
MTRRQGRNVVIVAIAIIVAYLIYRQWWIAQNCYGSIGGTEICK